MKKLILISFLIIFTAPFFIPGLWLKYKKYHLRKSIKEHFLKGIEKEQLTSFTFSVYDTQLLYWEHEDEFEYQDEMYDVFERKAVGDSITYWCWPDKEETALGHILEQVLSEAMNDDAENDEELRDFFKEEYVFLSFSWQAAVTRFSTPRNGVYLLLNHRPVFFLPPVPPPRTA